MFHYWSFGRVCYDSGGGIGVGSAGSVKQKQLRRIARRQGSGLIFKKGGRWV